MATTRSKKNPSTAAVAKTLRKALAAHVNHATGGWCAACGYVLPVPLSALNGAAAVEMLTAAHADFQTDMFDLEWLIQQVNDPHQQRAATRAWNEGKLSARLGSIIEGLNDLRILVNRCDTLAAEQKGK